MRAVVFCLVALLRLSVNCADIITVNNGRSQGEWGIMDVCPAGTLATGFSIKLEEKQGIFEDDTAVNGISLFCTKKGSQDVAKQITSTVGKFGSWKKRFFCTSGYLMRFCLRVDHSTHDNTAVTNIKFFCSDSEMLEADGLDSGSYGKRSNDCMAGICGIKSRVEPSQGIGHDDTALNDIYFLCCE